jgi:signal transduction histidine kinase
MDFFKKQHNFVQSKFSDRSILQARWLIRARWLIALSSIFAISAASLIQIFSLEYAKLIASSVALLLVNSLYYIYIKQLRKKKPAQQERKALSNLHWQIGLDFLFLTIMIYFSGGIENPAILFYVFHIIISSMILPVRGAILLAGWAMGLLISSSLLVYAGVLNHYPLSNTISLNLFSNLPYLLFTLSVFLVTSLLIMYFTITLAQRMRSARIELKQVNESLLAQDKIKNEYVYRVTHNIKGDLSSISGSLSVVQQQILAPVDEKNAEFIEKAFNRTHKLMNFVDDLLSLTSMMLNNRFEVRKLNFTELAGQVFEQMSHKAHEKRLVYTLEKPEEDLFMQGVKVSIKEAIMNLVSNAIKYTPEEGVVKLTIRYFKETIIFSAEDSGVGIASDELQHIFKEFYRAGNAGSIEGAGIGLSLVKAIVDRHKGKLLVKSEINKGSAFTILLHKNLSEKLVNTAPRVSKNKALC